MNNTQKKSNFSFRRLIYNDKYLIVISLVLALIIWIIASINIGTDESKTIKINVPITLGDEVSEQLGMQYYSLQDSIELSVTISGPKYVIGQVTSNDFNIKFDTSSVNRTGVQNIPILVTNKSRTLDFKVTNTYPTTIEAFYDVSTTKTFDLNLEFNENNVADGYIFGNPVISEDKVQITGPQTYIDKIDRAVLNVDFGDVTDLTEPYKTNCDIQVVGNGVEHNYLTISTKDDIENEISSVAVNLPVLKKTSLPVVVNLEDEPFDTGNNISIAYSQNELNAGVLDSANITEAVIGKVNFNQLTIGKNYFTFDVTNLHGITVLDDIKKVEVVITVSGNYSVTRIPISVSDVAVEGVESGSRSSVKSVDSNFITIISPKGTVITKDSLQIKCDVTEISKDNLYPIEITVMTDNNSWVYGKYKANIDIIK